MREGTWLRDYIVQILWPLLEQSRRLAGINALRPAARCGSTLAVWPAAAPTGNLAANTAANRMVIPLSGGLTAFDGSLASGKALLAGGMCATGGAAAATAAYYTSGPAPVGTTGWVQDVPLYPNVLGIMVPEGDPSLSGGLFTRACGVYNGTTFAVGIGELEYFA